MAKKLTLDDIQKCIKKADYYVFPGTTMTVCALTLLHDFVVIGKSACIDPDNFDESQGRAYAQQDAVQQIWELEGYLAMYKNAKGEDPVFGVSAINNPVEILTPEEPIPPPAESPPPPAPPVETAAPDAPMPTPSDLPIVVPTPEVPPSDPLPVDPPSPVEPTPSEPPVESPPAPPAEPAPEPAPPAPPPAFAFDKPVTELTVEELVVEEAAVVDRETMVQIREEAETAREAAWVAAHPDGTPMPPADPMT